MLARVSLFAACALLAGQASASIYTIKPTAKSTYSAGDSFTVTWTADSGDSAKTIPLAADFGLTSVGIYTGSATQQSLCQDLGDVDPAKKQELHITIDGKAGADSPLYFIRFQSYNATSDGGAPLQAFSSRFTLNGMTGTFTAAQIAINDGITDDSSTATSASGAAAPSSAASVKITKVAVATSSSTSGASGLAQQTARTTLATAAAVPGNGTEIGGAGRLSVGAGALGLALGLAMVW